MLHLETNSQRRNKPKRQEQTWQVIKRFGLFRSFFSGLGTLLLFSPIPKGECLVDFVAVHPDYQGQGIGTKLLSFGETIVKEMSDISSYALHVIGKNIGAIRLYQKFGFTITKSKRLYVGYLLTGIKIYHKMRKEL